MVHGVRPKVGEEKPSVYGDLKENTDVKDPMNVYGNWGKKAQPINDDD
jgi:hypothetical protein